MGGSRSHWEGVYAHKAETEVSWYQSHSVRSLELIEATSFDHSASVIDVGGGASTLVDDLLGRGFTDLTVLDLAQSALERSKARLEKSADKVTWVVADITCWTPGGVSRTRASTSEHLRRSQEQRRASNIHRMSRTWDIWHDRAVFHFLTEQPQQDAYVAALTRGTRAGSSVIIATFALDGPEKCTGLPVQRYSPSLLANRLGANFKLVSASAERHVTPSGNEQSFTYSVLERLKSI